MIRVNMLFLSFLVMPAKELTGKHASELVASYFEVISTLCYLNFHIFCHSIHSPELFQLTYIFLNVRPKRV